MPINTEKTGDIEYTITLSERFDFNCVEEFRAAYEGISSENDVEFVIDLRGTRYMDSSALGMLINMQKFWKNCTKDIRIINASTQVKKILIISRFDKKFAIE